MSGISWVLRGFFTGLPPGWSERLAWTAPRSTRHSVMSFCHCHLPPLFAAAIFAFIEAWNEFFFALILTRQTAQTVPPCHFLIRRPYQTVFGQNDGRSGYIGSYPVMILTIALRNTILRGFADGMLKG